MAAGRKKKPNKSKTTKKQAAKRQTYRDMPPVPTAKQIDASISSGRSFTLTEFARTVKF